MLTLSSLVVLKQSCHNANFVIIGDTSLRVIIMPTFSSRVIPHDMVMDVCIERTGSSLVKIMAWCLLGTKPLSKPMLIYDQLNHGIFIRPQIWKHIFNFVKLWLSLLRTSQIWWCLDISKWYMKVNLLSKVVFWHLSYRLDQPSYHELLSVFDTQHWHDVTFFNN